MGLEACNLPMGFKFYAKYSNRKESPDSGGKPSTVAPGTCDSRGVGGVDVLVNASMAKNIDSFEQPTTRIGRLRMRKCDPTLALTIFVAYAPTSSYDEEKVEAFYMDLEKFHREDHAFYKVIIGDFNAKVGPRRTPEELHIGTHGLHWNDQGERLPEFIMTTKTIHGNSQFQKPSSLRWTLNLMVRAFLRREADDELGCLDIDIPSDD
ncbi:hypothetical protein NECAME_16840 [Necator americanus]|uniref:Endonuclease/exonuclease/phosphatase domain-containing protein n=1 Tax=Necator americanus TaxID=51031 RepID=W2TW24_NECAM|nr:hypothetical protein NECAME_16840 [Necator americanus]ETN85247.1 hypothetical protein NECAME_16840 [Necator americanus]